MKPIDWTLIVIASAANSPLQPVQLQKSLFLLSRNLSLEQLRVETFYDFKPYDYGPFCSSVYLDAEKLEQDGSIVIQRPPAVRYKHYRVTEKGAVKATELEHKIDSEVIDYVRSVVAFTQEVSFNHLVSVIYKTYLEMKANSVFQE